MKFIKSAIIGALVGFFTFYLLGYVVGVYTSMEVNSLGWTEAARFAHIMFSLLGLIIGGIIGTFQEELFSDSPSLTQSEYMKIRRMYLKQFGWED